MISDRRLDAAFVEEGLEVMVASSPTNVFYLSRLESLTQDLLGERAFAVRAVDDDGPRIVLPATDASIVADADLDYDRVYTYGSFFIYERGETSDVDERIIQLKNGRNYDDALDALEAALDSLIDEANAVAFEQTGLSPTELERIDSFLADAEVRPAADLFQRLRRVKTPEERSRLRRSVEINQASIRAAVEDIEAGMTERDLANRYREHLCARGAEPLFTVVGFGGHGAYTHAVPGDRRLQEGDLMRFDVGCTYENYSSDIARTFAFRSAKERVVEQYEVLYDAMERSIDLLAGRANAADVFEGTRAFVRDSGAFEAFDRNHFGHGIGIEVYDPPTITDEANEITPGMVLCVEPPYYELGTGGIQVEDEVIVTEDGVERLSRCSEKLPVLE